MLILTHKCNLNCIYCYEQVRETSIVNVEMFKLIISDYLNSNKYDEILIEFFGGEPWLKKDIIIDICEWVWSKKWKNRYRFFTSTNGTLIHGDLQEWLHSHNKQISCGLSLDGKPNIHNYNRSNSFHKIDIPFFIENWPNQPVKMTITPHSIASLAENIIYIHNLGFQLAGTNFAEGIDWSNHKYIEILFQQLSILVKYYYDHSDIIIAPIINLPIENCEIERVHKPNKYCAVRSLIAYDTNGDAYPCNFITPMTFTPEQLESIQLSDFNKDDFLIDEYCYNNCYFYNICPNCYGANLLVNNNLSQRDKSMCNLIKLRAYFTAVIRAQYIINHKTNIDPSNKNKIALQIKAIEKIKSICEKEFPFIVN